MKEKDSVFIADQTAKINNLLKSIRNLLIEIEYDASGMPQKVFDGDKQVSLVFAGQYSAGKSSILKALTGIEDIEIGAGITTQKAHSYDWNGIEVIDTPGIHTTLRPDHDEISYQAIADADMLVYVITQELFDDLIGKNFRKLLIDKDKADEMILLVNKMADVGNTDENQKIKLKDLEKVTSPYTPAQLRTTFIDAQSYLESLSEQDDEIKKELEKRSNYVKLVSTLNTFVGEKNISSRITTVLYQLFDFLQEAVKKYQPSSGDKDINALEEHLLQERKIFADAQSRIKSAAKSIIEESASQIREKGRNLANDIYNYENESDAKNAINIAGDEVSKISDACGKSIKREIKELSKDCKKQIDKSSKSDFVKTLQLRLDNKYAEGNSLIERVFKSDVFAQAGKKIIANTDGTNAAANGLKAFTGSNIHKMVLDVGHFFGHSFKPWEALKWVKGINMGAKVLGIIGVVFSLGMQIKQDMDAAKYQEEMRDNREKIRAGFNKAASEVEKHFNSILGDFLSKNYIAAINDIDLQISEIRKMRIGKSETCKRLESAQADCKNLISEIHKSYSKD